MATDAYTLGRERLVTGARAILNEDLWCGLELCVDPAAQRWELRAVVLRDDPEDVADAITQWLLRDDGADWRLRGCPRNLCGPSTADTLLIHVAADPRPVAREISTPNPTYRRTPMLVRDGMNPIVVTVGPSHTLREAARRMTRGGVGAAVVFDPDLPGPGIITERDILIVAGEDGDLDDQLVREHLTANLVYAAAEWSLERAAEAMTNGRFRHVIVIDGADVIGILSMRDIVRCWVSSGLTASISAADETTA
ncbi:MAG: CBS domain-containing protein [Solirubrobacteraceae bacterium]